ncbi:MAG: L-seryl-tRNA(Sec) selenium transferase [Candidatus Erwinia impunctatus]|nr:L-seryl-tRNA(Sec) selenium transferase [Culicoides impunctatus]
MKTLFSQLPAIDHLLHIPTIHTLVTQYGHQQITDLLRALQQEARSHIRQHHALPAWCEEWSTALQQRLEKQHQSALKPVFNLTGTVLHTNLGRALLSETAVEAVTQAMRSPVTLEYALDEAGRGHRDSAIAELLCRLTGAEDACIVNNNAAAVLLMLAALAEKQEVVVSRGELVEIGGAFRIPDVMTQAGCQLREVGTTNRTHLRDYHQAINEQTALLMKVHTSNYHIEGFTHAVSEAELVTLGESHQLPVIADLGSGSLVDLTAYGLPAEPMPQDLIASGVSLVSFSGDKLPGGPQAGIIIGKKNLIERLQKHPLKRALRVDKMILAALEATLKLYLNPETLRQQLPTLRLLTRSQDEMTQQAERLLPFFQQRFGNDYRLAVTPCHSQIGSGALPSERLPGIAITFTPLQAENASLTQLVTTLRQTAVPIIGRIHDGKLWLDVRCLQDETRLLQVLTV